jgi:hypothetical protein
VHWVPIFSFLFCVDWLKRFYFFHLQLFRWPECCSSVEFVNNEAGEEHLVLTNMPAYSFVVYWIPDIQILIG